MRTRLRDLVLIDGCDVGADEGCGLLVNSALAAIGVLQLKVIKCRS
jgi:hypothetical protein